MAISEISVGELAALGTEIRLVDVREHDEWQDGHVSHAVHVPLGAVPAQLDVFDGDPTYVMCKVGGRSFRACELADGHGINVVGGMIAWSTAGLETVTGH